MSSNAADDAPNAAVDARWRAVKNTVFGAAGLTMEQKAAAWKQLRQQVLHFVEGLLDVEGDELTAVLLGEITGECLLSVA